MAGKQISWLHVVFYLFSFFTLLLTTMFFTFLYSSLDLFDLEVLFRSLNPYWTIVISFFTLVSWILHFLRLYLHKSSTNGFLFELALFGFLGIFLWCLGYIAEFIISFIIFNIVRSVFHPSARYDVSTNTVRREWLEKLEGSAVGLLIPTFIQYLLQNYSKNALYYHIVVLPVIGFFALSTPSILGDPSKFFGALAAVGILLSGFEYIKSKSKEREKNIEELIRREIGVPFSYRNFLDYVEALKTGDVVSEHASEDDAGRLLNVIQEVAQIFVHYETAHDVIPREDMKVHLHGVGTASPQNIEFLARLDNQKYDIDSDPVEKLTQKVYQRLLKAYVENKLKEMDEKDNVEDTVSEFAMQSIMADMGDKMRYIRVINSMQSKNDYETWEEAKEYFEAEMQNKILETAFETTKKKNIVKTLTSFS